MNKKNDMMKKALETLSEEGLPTDRQKEIMLNRVLMECKQENVSAFGKMKKMVIAYPWRVAFGLSAVQAVAFTLIFGTQYTNLFIGLIGG